MSKGDLHWLELLKQVKNGVPGAEEELRAFEAPSREEAVRSTERWHRRHAEEKRRDRRRQRRREVAGPYLDGLAEAGRRWRREERALYEHAGVPYSGELGF